MNAPKKYTENSRSVGVSETYVRQLWKNSVCELYKNGKSMETMFVHSVEMLMKKSFYAKFLLIFTVKRGIMLTSHLKTSDSCRSLKREIQIPAK